MMPFRTVLAVALVAGSLADAPATAQEPSGPPKLVLYTQPSLAGDSRSIVANFPNLEAVDFDNKARSVRVLAGAWEICEEKNFKKCQVVEANVMSLDALGLSAKISSVRLLHTARAAAVAPAGMMPPAAPITSSTTVTGMATPRITFFDKTNYRGDTLVLDAPRGNLAGLTARAESVRVVEGSWQLCTGMNYTGTCTTLAADAADLGQWRNRIVSARPVTPGMTPPAQ